MYILTIIHMDVCLGMRHCADLYGTLTYTFLPQDNNKFLLQRKEDKISFLFMEQSIYILDTRVDCATQ